LNILTIANAFGDDDVSGVDVVVKSYAKELIDKGHHVDILTRTRTSKSGWRYVEKIPACYVPMTVKRGR